MSSTDVDVKVVYSGERSRPVRAVAGGGPRTGASRGLMLVGLLTLVMAGTMVYVIWWPANHFIYMTFTTKTPMPGIDPVQAARLFGIRPSQSDSHTVPPSSGGLTEGSTPRFVGATATTVIGVSAYGWLTLSTVAACLLAMSAGAAWGKVGGRWLRRTALILFLAGLLGLAAFAWYDWIEYRRHFPNAHVRLVMMSFVALAVLLGLTVGRAVKAFFRIGAGSVILAGAATAAALYLGGECDAVAPAHCGPLFLFYAFVLHSSYGWVLLFLGPRVARS